MTRCYSLAEDLPVVVWHATHEGDVEYINAWTVETFGIPRERCLGWAWTSLLPPDERASVVKRYRALAAKGQPFELAVRLGCASNGLYRRFLARGVPRRTREGRIVGWLGTCTAVDDMTWGEAVLEESEHRLRTLMEHLPDGVLLLDGQGRIVAANAGLGELFGAASEQVIGLSAQTLPFQLIDREGAAIPREAYPATFTLSAGRPQHDVVVGRRLPDGSVKWLSYNTRPLIRDGESRPFAVVCSLSDVTAHINAEERLCRALQELSEANERLEKLDNDKDEFLSTVSHELKGPIGIMLGFASLLEEDVYGRLSGGQQECVIGMREAAESLSGLVSELLDISAIKAGTLRVYPQPSDLIEIATSAIGGLGVLAEDRALAVINAVPRDLPPVMADPHRVHQVLINLLTNAIKFTPEGGVIRVSASLQEGHVRCEVSDSGRGIAPEDLPKLFSRFTQLEVNSLKNLRGSGLGLSICKAIVEAQGGQIGVRSEPGQGSTFWFTLPLARYSAHLAPDGDT